MSFPHSPPLSSHVFPPRLPVMFPTFPIESNCRSIRHACRRQPNRRRTRQVSALFSVIATEASDFLPLFYRCPHTILLLTTLDSCFRSVAATRWHTALHFIPHRASLRIGLRCLHSPPCRTPARISGKDFPLPFSTGSNQPPLTRFFPSLPLFTFTCLFLSLSALYAIIVHFAFFF
jgi:hypothetical protein